MLDTLNSDSKLYHNGTKTYRQSGFFTPDQLERLEEIVSFKGPSGTPSNLWFEVPDCAQLAADTLLTLVEIHSKEGSTLNLPFTNTTYKKKPIIMQLYNEHFYLVKLFPVRRTYPTIYPLYGPKCREAGVNDQSGHYAN